MAAPVNASGVVLAADGARLYGLDAELYAKEQKKREDNKEWEIQLADWIEVTVGEPLADKADLWLSLKNGIVLCRLVNKMKPGTIKAFNTTRLLPLLEMDNIQIYLKALWQLGVNSRDLFVTADLYKKKGMSAVLQSIYALNLLGPKLGYQGALIGDEISKANQGNVKKARSWKEVETAPKKVRVDELMSTVGGPEGLIHSLQLNVAELNAEIMNLKAEKVSLVEEARGLKEKYGQGGKIAESVDEMQRTKRQLVEEKKERERLEYELLLVRKRVALSTSNQHVADQPEFCDLKTQLEAVQLEVTNLTESNFQLSEQLELIKTCNAAEVHQLKSLLDDHKNQSASEIARKDAEMQKTKLVFEDQTHTAANGIRAKQAELQRLEEQLARLQTDHEFELRGMRNQSVATMATKDRELHSLKLELASLTEQLSVFLLSGGPSGKRDAPSSPETKNPAISSPATNRRPPPPPASPSKNPTIPPVKASPKAPPPPSSPRPPITVEHEDLKDSRVQNLQTPKSDPDGVDRLNSSRPRPPPLVQTNLPPKAISAELALIKEELEQVMAEKARDAITAEDTRKRLKLALEEKLRIEKELFQVTSTSTNASVAEASINNVKRHLKLVQDELETARVEISLQRNQTKAAQDELFRTQSVISQLTLERDHHRRQTEAAKLDLSHARARVATLGAEKAQQSEDYLEAITKLEMDKQSQAQLNLALENDSSRLSDKVSELNLLQTNFQALSSNYAKLKADLVEQSETLREYEQLVLNLQAKAAYCLEPEANNFTIVVEPALQHAQGKLRTLLNVGAISNMELSDIGILNALVTTEIGRRVFTQTVQEHSPKGDITLTELNFKLMFNLVVNMLGEMLVSNSLDFHTILVVMDICRRVEWTDDRGGHGKITKSLQRESEIRTYFGQMGSQFWEELFWHKLTLTYKTGTSDVEQHDESERKDKWTEDLVLEFSWDMFTWGVAMGKVREVTNELAYFGLGLDNTSLARVLSSIEPHIRNKEKGTAPDIEVRKFRKGSVWEGFLTILDGKRKEKRFFVVSVSALISFKSEKSYLPLSYMALHPEVMLHSLETVADEWPLCLSFQEEELVCVFVSQTQRSEWMACINAVLTGGEDGLNKAVRTEEKDSKRLHGVATTAISLSGGAISLRDIINVASRIRAVPSGPTYNQPVESIHISSCWLGKYMSPFYDEVLKQCHSLVSLSLVNCDLGDRGAALLGRLLGGNSFTLCFPSLKSLDLQRNGITKAGASRLAAATAFNQSLLDVDLSLNSIEDMGAKAWADTLQTNTTLRTLRFLACGFSDDAVRMFLKVLDHNSLGDIIGFCAVLGCNLTADWVVEKGKPPRKGFYCGAHRPQPGFAVAPPLTNNTLLALDISGNRAVTIGSKLSQVLGIRKRG